MEGSPTSRSAAGAKAPGGRSAPVARTDHGVLQFSAQKKKGGVLGDDMRQMSGTQRLLFFIIALAIAGGVGFVAMKLVS